jgi:hypothetical protein
MEGAAYLHWREVVSGRQTSSVFVTLGTFDWSTTGGREWLFVQIVIGHPTKVPKIM